MVSDMVRGKEQTLAENEELLRLEEDTNDLLNISFTKNELNRALKKSRISTSEKDQICYITINHRSEASEDALLSLL